MQGKGWGGETWRGHGKLQLEQSWGALTVAAADPLGCTGPTRVAARLAARLAGRGQVVLLLASQGLRGPKVAAQFFPAADAGAKAVAFVPWPTRQALFGERDPGAG